MESDILMSDPIFVVSLSTLFMEGVINMSYIYKKKGGEITSPSVTIDTNLKVFNSLLIHIVIL